MALNKPSVSQAVLGLLIKKCKILFQEFFAQTKLNFVFKCSSPWTTSWYSIFHSHFAGRCPQHSALFWHHPRWSSVEISIVSQFMVEISIVFQLIYFLIFNFSCHIFIFQVDAHNIVPCWEASPKLEYGARTIRPKIHKVLSTYLTQYPPVVKHPHQAKTKPEVRSLV